MNQLDEDIRLRLLKGDQAAYRQLFDRYYAVLCRQAALQLGGDTDSAEDIVQQVFIDFWVQEKYKVIDISLIAYLRRMVQFKTVDHIRKGITRRGYEAGYGQDKLSDANPAETADVQQALHLAIAELPEQCRSIFTSVYLEGKKYREAALQHDISINTVKEQLRRATTKLRLRLKDFIVLLITLSPIIHYLNDC